MKTRQPLSKISFNTVPFLENSLNRLLDNHIITFWAFILHHAESDYSEGAFLKDHIHLYVEPYKAVDTFDLDSFFLELDPYHDKPLSVLSWRISKFPEWFLYATHDKPYMLEKGLTKQFSYSISDIHTSCTPELQRLVGSIERRNYIKYGDILDALERGLTFAEYVYFAHIPINQISYYSKLYDTLSAASGILLKKEGSI